jgi:hypothetical protein
VEVILIQKLVINTVLSGILGALASVKNSCQQVKDRHRLFTTSEDKPEADPQKKLFSPRVKKP